MVSLEWAGRSAPRGTHSHGRKDAEPLPTAALEGLMAASAQAHDLEIVSSKAEVYRSWGVPAVNPWMKTNLPHSIFTVSAGGVPACQTVRNARHS